MSRKGGARRPHKVYCVCKTDGNDGKFMVACDGCDGWFHPLCVGTTKPKIDRLTRAGLKFLCPDCSKANGDELHKSISNDEVVGLLRKGLHDLNETPYNSRASPDRDPYVEIFTSGINSSVKGADAQRNKIRVIIKYLLSVNNDMKKSLGTMLTKGKLTPKYLFGTNSFQYFEANIAPTLIDKRMQRTIAKPSDSSSSSSSSSASQSNSESESESDNGDDKKRIQKRTVASKRAGSNLDETSNGSPAKRRRRMSNDESDNESSSEVTPSKNGNKKLVKKEETPSSSSSSSSSSVSSKESQKMAGRRGGKVNSETTAKRGSSSNDSKKDTKRNDDDNDVKMGDDANNNNDNDNEDNDEDDNDADDEDDNANEDNDGTNVAISSSSNSNSNGVIWKGNVERCVKSKFGTFSISGKLVFGSDDVIKTLGSSIEFIGRLKTVNLMEYLKQLLMSDVRRYSILRIEPGSTQAEIDYFNVVHKYFLDRQRSGSLQVSKKGSSKNFPEEIYLLPMGKDEQLPDFLIDKNPSHNQLIKETPSKPFRRMFLIVVAKSSILRK